MRAVLTFVHTRRSFVHLSNCPLELLSTLGDLPPKPQESERLPDRSDLLRQPWVDGLRPGAEPLLRWQDILMNTKKKPPCLSPPCETRDLEEGEGRIFRHLDWETRKSVSDKKSWSNSSDGHEIASHSISHSFGEQVQHRLDHYYCHFHQLGHHLDHYHCRCHQLGHRHTASTNE